MPKTVMIVDDYADALEMMRLLIEWYGYEVIEAANGSEAVEKSLQYHPDLILMDLMLPVMDGAAAAKIIRESEANKKVSIVALTGLKNSSVEKTIESYFDGVLIKPLQFENLEPFLNRYLS